MTLTLEEREEYHDDKNKYICECGSKFKKYEEKSVMCRVLLTHKYTNKHMNYLLASK